jgi:hypothetical protein
VYHTYEVEAADHLSMGVSLYIPLDPNHRNDGEFRIAILGGDDKDVCVPAIDVYHILPQEVAGTMLHFSFSSMKTLLPGRTPTPSLGNLHIRTYLPLLQNSTIP